MSTMRAVQVSRPGGPLELVERPIPQPNSGQVRIKVQACGICHSCTIECRVNLARIELEKDYKAITPCTKNKANNYKLSRYNLM